MDSLDRHLRLTLGRSSGRSRNLGPARLGDLQSLVGGDITELQGMRCLVRERVYDPGHVHGDTPLAFALQAYEGQVEPFAYGSGAFDPARVAYLDLETTGLRNAMAFLVGLGFFRGDRFVLQQFFVPDPPDEEAMLLLLNSSLTELNGLVTFNGRSFDWPLLCDRYVRLGARPQLNPQPHLDLLTLSRRFWRNALPSCSLGSIENNRLGVVRKGIDIPGYLVPEIYDEYLRAGEIVPLEGVFYHNELDILSLVTLTARTEQLLSLQAPQAAQDPAECLSLGRLFEGRAFQACSTDEVEEVWFERAMAMYEGTIQQGGPAVSGEASERLGLMLKRWARGSKETDRRARYDMAMAVWRNQLGQGLVEPYVELAKIYEHQLDYRDLAQAHSLTQEALCMVSARRPMTQASRLTLQELSHRLSRLETKIAASQAERM